MLVLNLIQLLFKYVHAVDIGGILRESWSINKPVPSEKSTCVVDEESAS